MTEEILKTTDELNSMFEWYCNNFAENIQTAFNDFFGEKFNLKLVSVSKNINVLFQGEQYFVTRVRIDKNYDIYLRCSSSGLKIILDDILGENPKYDISSISDLEAKIISTFNDFTYNKVMEIIQKPEKGIKRKNFDIINLTFFLKGSSKNCGKFILAIPQDLVIPTIPERAPYDITKFNLSVLDTKIELGTTIFKLIELKSLEVGDTVVLENSNSSKMHIIYKDYEKDFQVFPRQELIIQSDDEDFGGTNMSENNELPKSLWDSIQVEMGAELQSVKITLGELRAIAQGQVMDLSSIYDSKVSLIVENQVVAKGELVIVNDRYGVKIDEVFEAISQGEYVAPSAPQTQTEDNMSNEYSDENPEQYQEEIPQNEAPQEGSEEEFDYSDFNLDEQDI